MVARDPSRRQQTCANTRRSLRRGPGTLAQLRRRQGREQLGRALAGPDFAHHQKLLWAICRGALRSYATRHAVVNQHDPHGIATLAGNGPVESYRVEVARRGLADRAAWLAVGGTGRGAALADADVFLRPSRQEGLPVAILEAMAGGAAVISTPVGAIGDAIIDGETGPWCRPATNRDPALRARRAANARKRFEAKFTIDRAADATAEMYRELGLA
jgi:glycosyl transferase family 1